MTSSEELRRRAMNSEHIPESFYDKPEAKHPLDTIGGGGRVGPNEHGIPEEAIIYPDVSDVPDYRPHPDDQTVVGARAMVPPDDQTVVGAPYPRLEGLRIRTFESGATRNTDSDELDYHGFLSPLVRKRYAEYMHRNRRQSDGSMRASDNWQKGIPVASYCSSLVRHVTDAELHQDGFPKEAREDLEDALCAVIFNAQGWLFELLKDGPRG